MNVENFIVTLRTHVPHVNLRILYLVRASGCLLTSMPPRTSRRCRMFEGKRLLKMIKDVLKMNNRNCLNMRPHAVTSYDLQLLKRRVSGRLLPETG